MPFALGHIKELQNLYLTIFLKNHLYVSWAIRVSLLLACCKSPSVKHCAFYPAFKSGSPSGQGMWGWRQGEQKEEAVPCLQLSASWLSQGDIRGFTQVAGQRGPFPWSCPSSVGDGKTRTNGSQFFRIFFLLLPRQLDTMCFGLYKNWGCMGSPVVLLRGWPWHRLGWPACPLCLRTSAMMALGLWTTEAILM